MRLRARSNAIRVGGAAVAMVIVAEAAVWLLAPREHIPEPLPVDPADFFGAEEITRAEDFRGGQRWLFIAGLAAEGALLVALASGRPAPARRLLVRLGKRPIAGAAAAGAGVALVTRVVTLPMSLAAHERAVDVGLSTQSLGSWLWDVARSAGITAVLTAGGTALLIALVRRFPRRWWIPGAAGVTAIAVVFTWLGPVVLAPIFNRFDPLPDGSSARADVVELGRRAGVEIGEVYRIDASRRGTSLNAYVDGIGSSKRVVLYDTLLADAEREELRSVVAHELGHVAGDDIRRGILYVAIVAPLGLLFVRELVERDLPPHRGRPRLAGGAACLSAGDHAGDVPHQRSREPALAQGRGDGRRLRARAHRGSAGARRTAAAARPRQPLRPRSAERLHDPVRHPPAGGRADRRGARLRTRAVNAVAQLADDGPESAIDRKESAVISRPRARSCSARHPRSSSRARRVDRNPLHLAGAGRFRLGLEGCAERLAEHGTEVHDARFDAGADVVGAARIGRRGGEKSCGHVTDEHIVARLLPVAEDDRHLAPEHRAAVDRDDAGLTVGILAGSVDVAEPEAGRLDAIEAGVERDISLGGELRLPVLSVRATCPRPRRVATRARRPRRRSLRRWRRTETASSVCAALVRAG